MAALTVFADGHNADVLPVRSFAGYCSSWPICGASRPPDFAFSGSARPFPACLGNFRSVGTEWNVRAVCAAVRVAKWSGRKSGESGRARAKPCRCLARNAEKRKYRLGAAGFRSDHQLSAVRGARQRPVALSRSEATRFGCRPSREWCVELSQRVGWNGIIRTRECVHVARDGRASERRV
jgi:hypothetical protein